MKPAPVAGALAMLTATVVATTGVVIAHSSSVAGPASVRTPGAAGAAPAAAPDVGTTRGAAAATATSSAAVDGASHAVAGTQRKWTARPATYQVIIERDVPITMSDGVRLYADVHRPAKNGKPAPGRFPVVLTQTPYNKTGPGNGVSEYLVSRGYVQVIADVRGTGSSRGTWTSFGPRERRDGYELVGWVASKRRPWSNGRVGTLGPSYMALNQFHTAAQRPPALKAAFTLVPGADLYRDVAMSGGQIDVSFMPVWLGIVTAGGLAPPAYTATDPGDGTLEGLLTLLEHAGNAQSFQGALGADVLLGGDRAFDSDWWQSRSPINVADKVRVPTFIVGGWYDLFQRGQPMLFDRLRRNGVPVKLLMGPWNHLQGAGIDVTDPGTPAPAFDEYKLRWFDHYLRGKADPTLNSDIAPLTYYELGAAKWRTATRWVDQDVHARAYQLDGPARPGSPGALTAGTAKTKAADTIAPIPVTGLCTRSASQWSAGNPLIDATCGRDQRVDSSLGTAYDLPAAKRTMRLLGPVNARLFVSTTADDGMITARLEDVAPDGTVKQLSTGWQVLSLRKLDRSRSLLRDSRVLQPWHPFTKASVQPVADIMEVHVEIFPTGAAIKPGHRLRLNLQAFDTPHQAAPLPQAANSLGVMSVHHDARQPSQVILPVRGS